MFYLRAENYHNPVRPHGEFSYAKWAGANSKIIGYRLQ